MYLNISAVNVGYSYVPSLCFAFLMRSRSDWRLSAALPNCVSDVSTAAVAADDDDDDDDDCS